MTVVQGHDLTALRQLNTRAVLAALLESKGPLTIRELATAANVSRPTVKATISSLLEDDLAREPTTPSTETRVGRPARLFELNADKQAVVGIDAGPRTIAGRLANLRGVTLHEEVILGDLRDRRTAFDSMTRLIDRLLAETPFSRSQLAAVSIGVPGVVDSEGDIVLSTVTPEWSGSAMREQLVATYGSAVILFDNDTKLAAVAEKRDGMAQDLDDFVYLFLSDRIAASAFVNGRLFRGAHGAAGEVGALTRFGWTAAYERYRSRIGEGATADSTVNHKAAEALALSVSEGLAALCLSLDPQAVIIGGEPLQSDPLFIESLRHELATMCIFPPPLIASSIPDHTVQHGAIGTALEHIRSQLLETAS